MSARGEGCKIEMAPLLRFDTKYQHSKVLLVSLFVFYIAKQNKAAETGSHEKKI